MILSILLRFSSVGCLIFVIKKAIPTNRFTNKTVPKKIASVFHVLLW
ncbi:Uncharacterised protein, partial [Mycoplasma putrefaciens]